MTYPIRFFLFMTLALGLMACSSPHDNPYLHAQVSRLAGQVRDAARHETVPEAARTLQRTLNGDPDRKGPRLKIDGVVGPKTRGVLRNAIVHKGESDVHEAFALNRFKGFSDKVASGERKTDDLDSEARRSFASLYPKDKPELDDTGALPWSDGIQETINQFQDKVPQLRHRKPLLLDARIGPKTSSAFKDVVKHVPTPDFANQLGRNLMFLGQTDNMED